MTGPTTRGGFDHDVVVVVSGFGGSVAALRLAEKSYDVLVYEAGRRFADHELPRTSWDLRRYLWAPAVGMFGIQRIHRLPDVLVLAGAGPLSGHHPVTAVRRDRADPEDVAGVGGEHRLRSA